MIPNGTLPALRPDEWQHRRSGSVSVFQVGDEMHVLVTDPDGEVVSVSGPDELFALTALANDALSDDDPRKIDRQTVFDLRVAAELSRLSGYEGMASRLTRLAGLWSAMLPPLP